MKTPRAICVAAGLMLASVAAQPGACPEDSPAHPAVVHPQADADERGRLLAVGRKLFVARCSRCHGERGEKSLSTGLPLSQRKLMPEQLARSVKGRLQDCTEEQRWAVQLYIESFLNQESRERTSN
jgi:mono/diheme cytochrome c family protein